MQDCVIGCFSGYGWAEVQVWARSLAACGFVGRKVAVTRAAPQEVLQALMAHGFDIVDSARIPATATPVVQRFADLRRYLHNRRLRGQTFRWVVATDVRDVCFQRSPVDYLARLDPPRLVLSPEGLSYQHEAWNATNMEGAFGPETLALLREAAPCNAGVLAGGHEAIERLALLIEHLSRGATISNPDQAALNLLVTGLAGVLDVHRAGSAQPWACQAGVMAAPHSIERNRPHLLGPEPVFHEGRVLTAAGEPYAIVHQYDRVPTWNAAITARYAG